jgi:hypothetical protein
MCTLKSGDLSGIVFLVRFEFGSQFLVCCSVELPSKIDVERFRICSISSCEGGQVCIKATLLVPRDICTSTELSVYPNGPWARQP